MLQFQWRSQHILRLSARKLQNADATGCVVTCMCVCVLVHAQDTAFHPELTRCAQMNAVLISAHVSIRAKQHQSTEALAGKETINNSVV